jgi:hypothetical protein
MYAYVELFCRFGASPLFDSVSDLGGSQTKSGNKGLFEELFARILIFISNLTD